MVLVPGGRESAGASVASEQESSLVTQVAQCVIGWLFRLFVGLCGELVRGECKQLVCRFFESIQTQ